MKRHWHLDRRTLLKGIGATMALPYLQCMADDPSPLRPSADVNPPKRFCGVFFPFGASLPPKNNQFAKWNWLPFETGSDYAFTESNKALKPHRHNITFLSGLSHHNGHKMGGHDTGDIFLTGAYMGSGKLINTISLDQIIDHHVGEQTRYGSLILSSDGGVGEPTRAMTLSFSPQGRPIPALNNPAQIYARLFGSDNSQNGGEKQQLQFSGNLLDRVLSHSKSIRSQLGVVDQRIYDQYLDSVDATSKRVARAQEWLKIAKPQVDKGIFKLEADQSGPADYVRVMYELMAYAIQTDSVRAATFMIGQVAGATTIANAFPTVVGLNNWHGLAHGATKNNGYENWGKFDQFLTNEFAHFIKTLDSMKEGPGSVLDNTITFYGTSNSKTHNNTNYPLLLAGGKALGMRHGQHHKLDEKTPLANVFVTLLQRLGINAEQFADSNGHFNDVL